MDFDILLLGLIITIGFLGNILFKYTKVPESLFMILIGLAVGPVFKMVDQTLFITYMPFFSTLTLIIILLDSGFSLSIFSALRNLSKAIQLTLLVLIFSAFSISIFLYLLGWDILHALFIGSICSGTTTVVVAYLLPRLNVPEKVRETLILESIVNDVTLITVSVILLQIIQLKTIDPSQIIVTFIWPIITAILCGIAFVIVWVGVLWKFYRGEELIYVFTLGVLFILYSSVNAIGGNSAIAMLIFSLTLGNLPTLIDSIQQELIDRKRVISRFQMETFEYLRERFSYILNGVKKTQINFSFFIKNFFFVYLGIIFDLEELDYILVVYCLGMISLMLISRYVSVRILAHFDSAFKKSAPIMALMIARGFTATFVTLLPASKGIEIPQLKEMMLLLVMLTTFTTITGSIIYARLNKGQENPL